MTNLSEGNQMREGSLVMVGLLHNLQKLLEFSARLYLPEIDWTYSTYLHVDQMRNSHKNYSKCIVIIGYAALMGHVGELSPDPKPLAYVVLDSTHQLAANDSLLKLALEKTGCRYEIFQQPLNLSSLTDFWREVIRQ